ncbi:MAG: nucleotidyltransferase family protein, partial [Acidobacteria bacterium]|nr:nucleotidyltransferase family protein [Acidobacteriota bacterium]
MPELEKQMAARSNLTAVPPSLLALLSHRWGTEFTDQALRGEAHVARVNIWRRNQQRFLMALSIARTLTEAGVPCLFLKGVALVLRHYGDAGLRSMEDVDLLVRPADAGAAAEALARSGWHAENGASAADIVRQSRVHHAWQFNRAAGESCDLHWHPVVRCYSPRVHDWFWQGAVEARMLERQVRVPCATDQLFHVCAHGLQWSWTSQVRWVPDALTVLQASPAIDWDRLRDMATEAGMSIRLAYALRYLRDSFGAGAPDSFIEELNATPAGRWERKEFDLLQKECPLRPWDRILWHTTHFTRMRRFDPE